MGKRVILMAVYLRSLKLSTTFNRSFLEIPILYGYIANAIHFVNVLTSFIKGDTARDRAGTQPCPMNFLKCREKE